jgi:hypothetical protein
VWRVWLFVGWLIWLVTITASGAMNFIAGHELGRSHEEAYVFAALGVGADGWKALGPVFIVALLRSRRHVIAALAGVVWIACFVVAVSAALGLAAKNRTALTDARESVRSSFDAISRDLRELETRQSQLGLQRTQAEIEASIASVLARPVVSGEHVRGTVASISAACTKTDGRTATACAEIAALREEVAAAKAGQEVQARIVLLRDKAEQLRRGGGTATTDPQSNVISRLSWGFLAAHDVGLALMLAMVGMIELVSAFTPVVLTEYGRSARATRVRPHTVATGRDGPTQVAANLPSAQTEPVQLLQVGGIFDYMAERVRPSPMSSVRGRDLHADYVRWCAVCKRAALSHKEFFDEFERICAEELGRSIRRVGNHYVGLVLADDLKALPAQRVG